MKEFKKPNSALDEKTNKPSLDSFKNIPNFIEEVNQNILNLDNMLSNNNNNKKLKSSMNIVKECNDLQNIVKQSVEGLSDIINMKNKVSLNPHSSCRTLGKSFEIIEEELMSNKESNFKNLNCKNNKKTDNNKIKSNKTNLIKNFKIQKPVNNLTNNVKNENSIEINNSTSKELSNSKLNKNIQILKEKLSNKIVTKPQPKRDKSINKRTENDEKENKINKSPMQTKNYQLKPRKNNRDNANMKSANRDDSKSKYDIYYTDNKIISDNDRNTPLTSRNVTTFNIETTTITQPDSNELNIENIQNLINMIMLFNDYNNPKIRDYNNKLVSDDLSKLLTSLIETIENKNDITLGFENSSLCNIKHGLKNKRDEKKFNSKSLDIDKIIIIQRKWREYITQRLFRIDDKEKLKLEMKKNILNSFAQIDQVKKIFFSLNSLIGQFNSFVNKNKKFSDLLNVYLMLGSGIISEENYYSLLRNMLSQSIKECNYKQPFEEKLTSSAIFNENNKNKLISCLNEEKEHDSSIIPNRYKNDLIYPNRFKEKYGPKIQKYEFIQQEENSVSKDWDKL